ncbi:uncharacterized protein [Musca autumnalis]|uniref:uncharacterized protein n=1 Tax=Musca autumnalis TaxID=221902 RepID=UPI003CEFB8DB
MNTTRRNITHLPGGHRQMSNPPVSTASSTGLGGSNSCLDSIKETSTKTKSTSTFAFKRRTKIACWNVRTLYECGKLSQLAKEREKMGIDILGVSECRWNGSGLHRLQSGETLIYSGRDEKDIHSDGVALLLSRSASTSLINWNPVNERILTARFHSRIRNITIVQVYAPTETSVSDIKTKFYSELDKVLSKTPKGDILICMGDFNSKVGKDNTTYKHCMGKHGIGVRNENGELLLETCSRHGLIVGGTCFKHKRSHKTTWISPDRRTENQIDHFCISRKWKHNLCDVRVKRSADIGSDHHLLLAIVQMKVSAIKNTHQKFTSSKFDVEKLKYPRYQEAVENDLNMMLEQENVPNEGIEERWEHIKNNLLQTCENVLGHYAPGKKEWMSPSTWSLIEDRRNLKISKNNEKSSHKKIELEKLYTTKNKEVRTACRRDKRAYTDELAMQANEAANRNDTKAVYDITKRLAGRHKPHDRPIKSKDGTVLTNIDEQISRWRTHFMETLDNTPNSPSNFNTMSDVPIPTSNQLSTEPPSLIEIENAIKRLKNNKAPGYDREIRPTTVVVPENIDAVRELIMQDRHVTYRHVIEAYWGILPHSILHEHLREKASVEKCSKCRFNIDDMVLV